MVHVARNYCWEVEGSIPVMYSILGMLKIWHLVRSEVSAHDQKFEVKFTLGSDSR